MGLFSGRLSVSISACSPTCLQTNTAPRLHNQFATNNVLSLTVQYCTSCTVLYGVLTVLYIQHYRLKHAKMFIVTYIQDFCFHQKLLWPTQLGFSWFPISKMFRGDYQTWVKTPQGVKKLVKYLQIKSVVYWRLMSTKQSSLKKLFETKNSHLLTKRIWLCFAPQLVEH